MKIERPNQRELSPEEKQDLEKLKKIVRESLADGKFSRAELDRIRAAIYADRKVTPEEMRTIQEMIKETLGDEELQYDWD